MPVSDPYVHLFKSDVGTCAAAAPATEDKMKRASRRTADPPRIRHRVAAASWQPAQGTAPRRPPSSRGVVRIEVTGINIPRTEGETALPVQIITREEIARSGSTTVAEVMAQVSANILGYNDQLSLA